MNRPSPLLDIRHVTKAFGPVVACDDISFEVHRGEIMGLLGQNGAGKSTLMKVVAGVESSDLGEILVDGKPLPLGDPAASARAGIGMVHQHFSLVGRLTVWQNVILGEKERFDPQRAIRLVREVGERFGLVVDPMARVEDLSAGLRQRVEIIKCLRGDPKVIILDEPTSVLTGPESTKLFEVLRNLVSEHGYAAVLISHRLSEILHATDRVTVLRSGAVVGSMNTVDTDAPSLANMMLGRNVSLERDGAALGLGAEDEVFEGNEVRVDTQIPGRTLSLDSIVVKGEHGNHLLDELSLEVRAGEIVGLAGVEGNGQGVLVEVLSRLTSANGGRVEVVDSDGTRRAVALSDLGIIPADRHDSGCVLDMSVAENLVMNDIHEVARGQLLKRGDIEARAVKLIAEFGIAAASHHAPMWTLSGGNQQKVVVARELSRRPAFIIAEQPTRGLDVGAMEYMWHRLREAAAQGAGVLLVSTELDEILALSTRIAVIFRGRILGEMSRDDVELERLGLMMGGQAA
jgi:simple sugar transport system ATP-binding protein